MKIPAAAKSISVLLFTILALTLYSLSGKELVIFGYTIRHSDISSYFSPGHEKAPAVSQAVRDSIVADSLKAVAAAEKAVADTSKQHFLFIGDSMIEGLMARMDDYCAANGDTVNAVIWYGSTSKTWGRCDTLSYFIRKYKPTYLFICLGANELKVDKVNERDAYIKYMIKQVGTVKYVWIGPPNWMVDNGINALIKNNVGSTRYYPSMNLTFDRKKDGAHPTLESAAKWMDSVAVWLGSKKCANPILLKKPAEKAKRHTPIRLLKPYYK